MGRSKTWSGKLLAVGCVAGALLAVGQSAVVMASTGVSAPSSNVAWLLAHSESDVDKAFAQGRAEGKPVLVYWGAAWCPPCNQLKATLFNRQDFAQRAKHVVPLHVDGDLPGAQKLGARFKVRGYPTMILFSPQGEELTRLPGEVDAPMVMQLLEMGMAGGRPIKQVLRDARQGQALKPAEWKMLAYYGWEIDESQLLPAAERAAVMWQLIKARPPAEKEIAQRLVLKALTLSESSVPQAAQPEVQAQVRAVLSNPAQARQHMDVLVNAAPELVRALAPQPGKARQAWVQAVDEALVGLQQDLGLSRSDRVSALLGRVELARLEQPAEALHPKLAEALVKQVKAMAVSMDKEIQDGYERQAVITSVAHLLARSGLWRDSDALLQSNLTKSHSPYYLMSQLGGNARRQGQTAAAVDWYAKAWERSEGPATRLQWGANYVSMMVELAPQDEPRIEHAAAKVLDEAGRQAGGFYERSGRSVQKLGQALGKWAAKGSHQEPVNRLRQQLAQICTKLPTEGKQKETCEGAIKS